jgi:hypothetical protein
LPIKKCLATRPRKISSGFRETQGHNDFHLIGFCTNVFQLHIGDMMALSSTRDLTPTSGACECVDAICWKYVKHANTELITQIIAPPTRYSMRLCLQDERQSISHSKWHQLQ